MAFGSMSGALFESSSNRSPEPAVLFYATDDERAGGQVEQLIRTAGFEPMKSAASNSPVDSRWAATFTIS
jgi:8-hydroxy-5-deazaflavin:NADPH oxidoreductase